MIVLLNQFFASLFTFFEDFREVIYQHLVTKQKTGRFFEQCCEQVIFDRKLKLRLLSWTIRDNLPVTSSPRAKTIFSATFPTISHCYAGGTGETQVCCL